MQYSVADVVCAYGYCMWYSVVDVVYAVTDCILSLPCRYNLVHGKSAENWYEFERSLNSQFRLRRNVMVLADVLNSASYVELNVSLYEQRVLVRSKLMDDLTECKPRYIVSSMAGHLVLHCPLYWPHYQRHCRHCYRRRWSRL